MPRRSAAGLDFRIIPAGFNAPLEFLTGFTQLVPGICIWDDIFICQYILFQVSS
jgi:hypothetical protein